MFLPMDKVPALGATKIYFVAVVASVIDKKVSVLSFHDAGVFATTFPFLFLELVFVREYDRLSQTCEMETILTYRQSYSGSTVVSSLHVFRPEKKVNLPIFYDCRRIVGIPGLPFNVFLTNRILERKSAIRNQAWISFKHL